MSKEDRKIYKPKAISGFPEWLPEERLVEQKWLDHIRRVFESYGFCNIETPSVEELDVLTAKGEVDKEIYVIERLHKDDNDKEARLALHFDQTVPMARYVAQRFNDLVFPFKRYQMQRVWRGERPQMGRMREFYQCDIDIINVDNLPISFDAEVAAVMYEVLEGLNIGRVQLRISNRKILMGLLEGTGIDPIEALRVIDKREKMPPEQFANQLMEVCSASHISESAKQYRILYNFIIAGDEYKNLPLNTQISMLESNINASENETFKVGITELVTVLKQLQDIIGSEKIDKYKAVIADLSIVRGLDYYTGTVYETKLLDVPEFIGSVCSGGRYDDLAGSYINKHLPGVGISIGFSRLFDIMRQTNPGRLGIGPKSPADVLMVLPSEELRKLASDTARTLRSRGVKVELYHAAKSYSDQMKYARRKGIPFVWFPPVEKDRDHEVRDMEESKQEKANPATWIRPDKEKKSS